MAIENAVGKQVRIILIEGDEKWKWVLSLVLGWSVLSYHGLFLNLNQQRTKVLLQNQELWLDNIWLNEFQVKCVTIDELLWWQFESWSTNLWVWNLTMPDFNFSWNITIQQYIIVMYFMMIRTLLGLLITCLV